MTHKEAMLEFFRIPAPIEDGDIDGFTYRDINGWLGAGRIPLIHIPELALWIGVKPSEIDPFFIGKDEIRIDWSSDNE